MKWIVTVVLVLLCVVRAGFFYIHQPQFLGGEQVHMHTTVRAVYMDSLFRRYIYVSQLRIVFPEDYEARVGDTLDISGTVQKSLTVNGNPRYDLHIGTFLVKRVSYSFEYIVSTARDTLIKRVLHWMPGNEGGLLAGIVLGGNAGMTSHLRSLFARVGLTHIIAAFGYNVSVIVGVVQLVSVRLFGRRISIYFVVLCTILYALLAGFGAPIVRATFMAIVVIIGRAMGRRALGMWTLFLTLVFMLLYDPHYVFDVSFQLSASATAGLIFSERFTLKKSFLLANLITGVLVTLASLPVTLYHFSTFAWVSPILTIAVTLLVPYIMFIGLFSLAIGLFVPIFGQIGVWFAWPLLKLIVFVVSVVGEWSWIRL